MDHGEGGIEYVCGLALCHMRMRIYYILFEEGLSTLINRPKKKKISLLAVSQEAKKRIILPP